jgi:tungstate transport system substrate-binding protein
MNTRRRFLRFGLGTASLAMPALAGAAQARSLADPLRLAADDALVDSGLAPQLQRGFGRDTGVAVQLLHGPATTVLQALEAGEHDAALTNAPDAETPIERQGLLHDRRLVAVGDFVLVGPAALAKPLAAPKDIGLALVRLAEAQVPFVSRADGSGTHLAELAAWRVAKTAPGGAWYRSAPGGPTLVAQAREQQACAVVERGVWAAQAFKGHAVLADDARMAVDVHVMRSFHTAHPAGKLFVAWLTGPKGRAVVAGHRGYRAAQG